MIKALGINIYGGGQTLGVIQAGYKVVAQLEEITLGKRTFDMNFGGKIPRPLNRSEWPIEELRGKIPYVYANPPCAPWSIANNHKGKTVESRFLDSRLNLTDSTYRAAIEIGPEVFIAESVEAAYNVGKTHYEPYVKMWMDAGYSVTWFLTDALLHGAPCQRRRFHFIAHKHKLQLGDVPIVIKPMTVRDAIGDLGDNFGSVAQHEFVKVNEHHARCMPYTPIGGKLAVVIQNLPTYPGPKCGFLIRRLAWDCVSPTVVGFNFIHPDGKRWITMREALRLCTYPDTFLTHNAVEAVDTVLPIVGKFLAEVAKKTIKKKQRCEKKFEIIDWRSHGKQWHIARQRGKPLDYSKLGKLIAYYNKRAK